MKQQQIKYKLSDIIKVVKNKYGQPLYDMYQVTIVFNGEEKQVIKVFCKHNTIDIRKENSKVKRFFFIDRVFGLNGQEKLIDIQQREDYIFLGELIKISNGRYEANRFYEIPGNQMNAEDYFNANYQQIKQAIEMQNGRKEGKNYAISDIHGMYGSYMEVIKYLKEEDTLHIIGDAIDRGKNGIAILQDIISRQQNKGKVIFFLGNHEVLMLESLDIIKRHNIKKEEIEKICEAGYYLHIADKMESENNEDSVKQNRNIAKQIIRELSHFQMDDAEIQMLYKWLKREQGQSTFDAFCDLTQEEQTKIYEFLLSANIFGQKEINDRKVLFVHAAPYPSQAVVDMFKNMGDVVYKCSNKGNINIRNKILEYCLQERNAENAFRMWKQAGYLTIYGHTPQNGEIKKNEDAGCICIDSGCGHKNEKSKLALYCIEDESVIFLDEKENDTINPQNNKESR